MSPSPDGLTCKCRGGAQDFYCGLIYFAPGDDRERKIYALIFKGGFMARKKLSLKFPQRFVCLSQRGSQKDNY